MIKIVLGLFNIFIRTNWMKHVFVLSHLEPQEKIMWYALRGTSKEDREGMRTL